MLTKAASNLIRAGVEAFTNKDTFSDVSHRTNVIIVNLIVLALVLIIILVAGQWLWNNVACKLITVIKPVPSVWHLLGLIVLIDLIMPNCIC